MLEKVLEINMRSKIGYAVLCFILLINVILSAYAEEPKELTIFCGAGLAGAFNEIWQLYENASDIGVAFNFDGVPSLRAQIENGAYADVLVSSNLKHMDALKAEGLINNSTVKIFARNKVAVVVPNDNPANIVNLTDLARPGIMILMGTRELPIGDYARQVLDKLANDSEYGPEYKEKVISNIVSEETTVNRIVSKVALGEVDAGFAFMSDVSPSMVGKVTKIPIPDKYNVVGDFPVGVLSQSNNTQEAQAFIDVIMSNEGQAILDKYGFIPVAKDEADGATTSAAI
ncbi:MAG: molybdate ABC transporter substrate-binding protein [Methanothrix sp.]